MNSPICVVVADSTQVRIFASSRRMDSLDELCTLDNPEGRLRDQELETDRSGRQSATRSAGYHGYGGDKSTQRHETDEFALEVARQLEQRRRNGEFDQLILVAPPKLLGDLRKHMSSDCDRLVSREINKNLLHEDHSELLARLREKPDH